MWTWIERASTLLVVVVALFVAWNTLGWEVIDIPSEPVSLEGAETIGDPGAPVVLVVHSDFECPYCRRFALETWPTLKREFVDTGVMLGAFRHLPLDIHANAKTAAEAAACAGRQGLFWQMHDRQFAAKAKLETAGVVSLAEGLGLDMSQFRKCLEGEELSAKIRDEVTSAAALGIRSTPTILIGRNDGQKHVVVSALLAGAKPVAAFRDAIETARTPPSTYYGVGSVASVIALGGFWFISRNRKKPNKN